MNGDKNEPSTPNQNEGGEWQYTPDQKPVASEQPIQQTQSLAPSFDQDDGDADDEISWTASEFIAHNKGVSWYVWLFLAGVALAVGVWFFTKDIISVIVIIIVSILLGVAAVKKPRVLEYHLDSSGIEIEGRFYSYAEFKSFSVMDEGAFASIMFVPFKRFMPPISIYYDPEDEDKIATVISHHLPLEQRDHDFMDRFARRIRF